jgi:hypothetical protein
MSSIPTYRVIEPIRAVQFTQESGMRQTTVLIPKNATVRVLGPGLSESFMKIQWESELYSVLRYDLQSSTEKM